MTDDTRFIPISDTLDNLIMAVWDADKRRKDGRIGNSAGEMTIGDVVRWVARQPEHCAYFDDSPQEGERIAIMKGTLMEAILYNFHAGRYSIAIFSVWLGFSSRSVKPYRVVDAGYIKVMWLPGSRKS